jgi:DmsE family decaheme c-type cytochrome
LFATVLGAQDQPAGYAGSETCGACHEDIFKAFQKNPHHIVETQKKRGWETRACESCHGPGAKHAESASPDDILNPAKLTPRNADQTCLKCHLNEPTHMGRIGSGHAKNQVACVSCHSVHKGQEQLRPRRASAINQQCAACHASVWAQFQRPHKHPLPQGAMSCVNCHDPHGSVLHGMVRTVSANEPSCLKCHGDKRGPFTFNHPPVQLEGCQTCHEPHGSANPRMLNRAEQRFVCFQCHVNTGMARTLGGVPPAFHDLRSPRFRNCTICHRQIHGSYVDPGLQR